MHNAMSVIHVALLAYQGVDELDLFGAYSVLVKAADAVPDAPDAPVLTVTLAGTASHVVGSGGLKFDVTAGLDVLALADAVLVPGGRGARTAADDPTVRAALTTVIDRGGRLYGVCTGSLIIAATGAARHSRLAIHRNKRTTLAEFPVGNVEAGLIHDGGIVTVGGDLSTSVKSVDIAFALLGDLVPHLISVVSNRMEILPGRHPISSPRLAEADRTVAVADHLGKAS